MGHATVYFEDVALDTEIPELRKTPSRRQLVQWAVASGDLNEIHYDKDAALAAKLPGVIVHGRLKAAFLGQTVSRWIGPNGRVTALSCSYRGMDVPEEAMRCSGRVIEKHQESGRVRLELWIENEKGERTTVGNAWVILPLRSGTE